MDPHNIPDLSRFKHSTPIQIRFNDVDVLGHVNNAVYLTYYDTAKAHYFTSVRKEKVDWKHVDTVIANVNCAYMAPILFGEEIEVLTSCISISEKSFRLLQIIKESDSGEIKSMCESVMVCFNPEAAASCRVPDLWRTRLSDFEGYNLENK